jgi:hypothetical protein
VQDDVLINRIDQQLAKNPQAVRTQEDGLTLCTLNLPLPMSYVHPTVAWKKGCLILASNDAIIREMMAVKAGKKPGFAANADFQKLRAGMPESGCKFAYVSPLFFKTMRSLQTVQVEHNQAATPAVKNLMQYIYRVSPQNEFYSVRQETEEGWIGIVHQKAPVPAAK